MFSLLFVHWGGGRGTPAKTRTGYPLPRHHLIPTLSCPHWPGKGQDIPCPTPAPSPKSGPGQGTPPPPPPAGNATDRIQRGRYVSSVFTQEDVLVCHACGQCLSNRNKVKIDKIRYSNCSICEMLSLSEDIVMVESCAPIVKLNRNE